MIDSDLFGTSILTLALILLGAIVTLFNPYKQKRKWVRYCASILNTISLILLLSNALVFIPSAIFSAKDLGCLEAVGAILVPICFFFAYRQVRSLTAGIVSFRHQIRSVFQFNIKVIARAVLFFHPCGCCRRNRNPARWKPVFSTIVHDDLENCSGGAIY